MSAMYFKGTISMALRVEGRDVGSRGVGVSPSPTTLQQIPAIECGFYRREINREKERICCSSSSRSKLWR